MGRDKRQDEPNTSWDDFQLTMGSMTFSGVEKTAAKKERPGLSRKESQRSVVMGSGRGGGLARASSQRSMGAGGHGGGLSGTGSQKSLRGSLGRSSSQKNLTAGGGRGGGLSRTGSQKSLMGGLGRSSSQKNLMAGGSRGGGLSRTGSQKSLMGGLGRSRSQKNLMENSPEKVMQKTLNPLIDRRSFMVKQKSAPLLSKRSSRNLMVGSDDESDDIPRNVSLKPIRTSSTRLLIPSRNDQRQSPKKSTSLSSKKNSLQNVNMHDYLGAQRASSFSKNSFKKSKQKQAMPTMGKIDKKGRFVPAKHDRCLY